MSDDNRTDKFTQVIKPDFSLKRKIGKDVNIKNILNEAVEKKATETIKKVSDDFQNIAIDQIKEMEEYLTKIKACILAEEPTKNLCNDIAMKSLSIKGQAGMLGYPLASKVSSSMHTYASKIEKVEQKEFKILNAYVKTLRIIFEKKISSETDPIAIELLKEFQKVIDTA